MNDEVIDRIVARSQAARDQLLQDSVVGQYIDRDLPHIPRPFVGIGDIRLIIIGQDPTVQRAKRRASIKTVLTLDEKNGLLSRFLGELCDELGLSLREHVYATNACKCFFTSPPTTIHRDDDVSVLEASAPVWLPILRDELAAFPCAVIISLGEPVLAMLVRLEHCREMKHYWGYHRQWKDGKRTPMCPILPEQSSVDRQIFPFIHQPTQRGNRAEFYRQRRAEYIEFIKKHLFQE